MENINGFYIEFFYSDKQISLKKQYRSFGVYLFEENDLLVLCQTSSNTDEALILAESYRKCEIDDFKPLRTTRGSFVLFDKVNNKIVAGRDMSMANRLYFYRNKDSVLFTTDSRLFLKKGLTLDASVVDWALNSAVVPLSWFKNVEAILPGHYLMVDKRMSIKKGIFWSFQRVDIPHNYREAVQCYGDLFIKSVKNNIKGDRAAVYLSGGSDSAAVMGALNKLQIGEVNALHMAIKGNYEFEKSAVMDLQKAYGFNLDFITPRCHEENWLEYVNMAILRGSINSTYLSFPSYQMMGDYFKEKMPAGTTVFNGEMCILDTGFTDAGDKKRKIKRWLYTEGGKILARHKIWPDMFYIEWDNHRKSYYLRNNVGDRIQTTHYLINTILHSFGRPNEYYLGMKMGWRYLPGYYGGISYLPIGYHSMFLDRITKEFMDFYCSGLKNRNNVEWRNSFNQFSSSWYCESANFTMPADVAHIGNLSMCFPFSDVDLFDFAASLPHEWKIDKMIQKDMCKYVLGMPDNVAYLMKNHKQSFSYFDYVYGKNKEQMLKMIRSTNFGPLTFGINSILDNKIERANIYSLYAISVLINSYNLHLE